AFFPRHVPDEPYAAFACGSWLLDPRFAFRTLTTPLDRPPRRTVLLRAVVDHLKAAEPSRVVLELKTMASVDGSLTYYVKWSAGGQAGLHRLGRAERHQRQQADRRAQRLDAIAGQQGAQQHRRLQQREVLADAVVRAAAEGEVGIAGTVVLADEPVGVEAVRVGPPLRVPVGDP